MIFRLFMIGGLLTMSVEGEDRLIDRLAEVTGRPEYAQAHFGLLIAEIDSGTVVLEHNPDKLFSPASVTKIFSTAAAWDALGGDYRFKTPIYRTGKIDEQGTLHGDLVLVASGDLTMGGRSLPDGSIELKNNDHTYANDSLKGELTETDPLAGLKELARQVAASGIKKIAGEVLIDDRLFDRSESSGSGPDVVSPILINDNLLDVLIKPGAPGQSATFEHRPQTSLIHIDFVVDTIEAGGKTEVSIGWEGQGRVAVKGKIASDQAKLVRVLEWNDPDFVTRGLLIEALRNEGIRIAASPFVGPARSRLPAASSYTEESRVAELVSPTFSENVKLILKVSHNLHASTLPLLVAAKHGKRTLKDGLVLEGAFLKSAGVDLSTISFGGGAGGALADKVTPRATVQLLRHLSTKSDFAVYEQCMPNMGVDGTLSAIILEENSPLRGKVFAKTGTYYVDNLLQGNSLLTSKALAGTMVAKSGKKYAFAFFVNGTFLPEGVTAAREGNALARLCEICFKEL